MDKEKYLQIARDTVRLALKAGAEKVRATVSASEEDIVATLDGEVDKVTHCDDKSVSVAIFADGRFGSFSTNKTDSESLESFLTKAVELTKAMAPDPARRLPDRDLICRTATGGDELALTDQARAGMTCRQRIDIAKGASAFNADPNKDTFKIVSEDAEWSDSDSLTVLADSDGAECIQLDSCFSYWSEITVETPDGEKYSGSWWDSACRLDAIDPKACALKSLDNAAGSIGAESVGSRKCTMVVDSSCASKMVSPILRALSAYSIQQHDSFLEGSLNKKIFPEGMTVVDLPFIKGESGSRLFDSEGLATKEGPIIDKGVVKQYFINTYMSGKMGLTPTVDEPSRPKVLGWPRPGMSRNDILALAGEGILVTDFNGGNSNSTTGDFSYGIEGFEFRDGKIVRPVSGMLVTGNFISLWADLLAIGEDSRPCMSKLIPTLAFSNVDFNG